MPEYLLNQSASVERVQHEDREIDVYVVDGFLQDPELLLDYARSCAYFGKVGDDRTAYPGIRDRLPKPYERAMEKIVALVYGTQNFSIHRCMLSLTTLDPGQLRTPQKMPHVDAFDDDQYAAVHYLCAAPHGGTAFYRYRQKNLVRLRDTDRHVVEEMLQGVRDNPEEHRGYLVGDTSLFKQEVLIEAKFNRLILYPSNLLHCAQMSSPDSYESDVSRGRLSVASFFRLDPGSQSGQRQVGG